MLPDITAIDRTLHNACQKLRAMRNADGHWEGELASSPLSTATAVIALALVDEPRGQDRAGGEHRESIRRGLEWLVGQQNPDGGWGDTRLSISNISTTCLGWAALVFIDRDGTWRQARIAAEQWLTQAAGSLDPERLVQVVGDRYGKDRTFSVPIVTTLALVGCLGDEPAAWRFVPQLPFELAACPRAWFKWLRLPVVSYALPALIALGRLRHRRRPTRNPLARFARTLAESRVLRVLGEIQPSSGGFLEATPLTSFVVMSLAASGSVDDPVVGRAVEFLLRSQRAEGSWPIDTNLATWVTTLSVNALATAHKLNDLLPSAERDRILTWLLDQQYHEVHPFTRADPGGWAWTDLPGGVPDADDTPGALLALFHLTDDAAMHDFDTAREAAVRGTRWLLDLQNRDGGVPTFCRGWGALPFDRSSADLTAHAMLAITHWLPELPAELRTRSVNALSRMTDYLVRTQRADGSWSPLWFGNQHASDEENPTYGTSRILRAAAAGSKGLNESAWRTALTAGCRWLLDSQNSDGGWGGAHSTTSSIEETSLAVEALAGLLCEQGVDGQSSGGARCRAIVAQVGAHAVGLAASRGAGWLSRATDEGRVFPPSPIGFYFAKLWYFEVMYPLIFTVAALGRVRSALASSPDRHGAVPAIEAPPVASDC